MSSFLGRHPMLFASSISMFFALTAGLPAHAIGLEVRKSLEPFPTSPAKFVRSSDYAASRRRILEASEKTAGAKRRVNDRTEAMRRHTLDQVFALDAILDESNSSVARDRAVRTKLGGRTVSLSSLFFRVELAEIRMRTALNRLKFLERAYQAEISRGQAEGKLTGEMGPAAGETGPESKDFEEQLPKLGLIRELAENEIQEYLVDAREFGTYADLYLGIKGHLEFLIGDRAGSEHRKQVSLQLLGSLGIHDVKMRDLLAQSDDAFKHGLLIAEVAAPTARKEEAVYAGKVLEHARRFEPKYASVRTDMRDHGAAIKRPDAEGAENADEKSDDVASAPVRKWQVNDVVVSFEQIADRRQDMAVMDARADASLDLQHERTFEAWMSTMPIERMALAIKNALPGQEAASAFAAAVTTDGQGPKLPEVKSKAWAAVTSLLKSVSKYQEIRLWNDNYFYDMADMMYNRPLSKNDRMLTSEEKVELIEKLADRGFDSDRANLTSFEFLARRAHLAPLWKEVVTAVNKPENQAPQGTSDHPRFRPAFVDFINELDRKSANRELTAIDPDNAPGMIQRSMNYLGVTAPAWAPALVYAWTHVQR